VDVSVTSEGRNAHAKDNLTVEVRAAATQS
jgi:hypothetical protein